MPKNNTQTGEKLPVFLIPTLPFLIANILNIKFNGMVDAFKITVEIIPSHSNYDTTNNSGSKSYRFIYIRFAEKFRYNLFANITGAVYLFTRNQF